MTTYRDLYQQAQADSEGFWLDAAKSIDWVTPPTRALDASNPPFSRWFPDGELNTCYNAVDRHVVAGRGDQKAIIYDSPITNSASTMSFFELQTATARFAGMLARLGIGKGDRVIIYMPMIPQSLVAMLGCARLGSGPQGSQMRSNRRYHITERLSGDLMSPPTMIDVVQKIS